MKKAKLRKALEAERRTRVAAETELARVRALTPEAFRREAQERRISEHMAANLERMRSVVYGAGDLRARAFVPISAGFDPVPLTPVADDRTVGVCAPSPFSSSFVVSELAPVPGYRGFR